MVANPIQTATTSLYLSEIFPIALEKNCYQCFRLSPEIDRETGNRFSWHLSKSFQDIVVIWDSETKYFWMLAKSNAIIPEHHEWRKQLNSIQEDLKEELGDRHYTIQWVREPNITPSVQSQLAVRILDIFCKFTAETVSQKIK